MGDGKTIETTDTRRHSINKVVLEKTPEQGDMLYTLAIFLFVAIPIMFLSSY